MEKFGIIGGSALLDSDIFKDTEQKIIKTGYGEVNVSIGQKFVFIQRHGKDSQPHKINHKANIQVMIDLGIKKIIAISSTGSLKKEIKPGNLIVIDDYMQLSAIPTFYDNTIKFTKPYISSNIRKMFIDAANQTNIDIMDKGVYIQTSGPRYETPAEVRMFSNFADIVGMTIASEATLANEAELDYGVLCSVDNYGNGLIDEEISWDKIIETQKKSIKKIQKILNEILK